MSPRDEAIRLWHAGVRAVYGYHATARALNGPRPDYILAVGKAASDMARAALDRYPDTPCLVVTKDGHGANLPDHVTLIEAAHPVPDARSLAAGAALRQAVQKQTQGAHLLLLVSGGASALAEDPVPGKDLDSLRQLNQRLLAQGLDIEAMNAERRKCSRIKGGGLLTAFRGQSVQVLAISDVPDDDIAVIGSGIGAKPDDAAFDYVHEIIASNEIARRAAADAAKRPVLENAETLCDDVSTLAAKIGPQLRDMPAGIIIFGGEPTVVLPQNPGSGGRNQALALELAREISGIADIAVLVAGTDGTDGPTDAAGGLVDGTTWDVGADQALAAADSGRFLAQKNARFVTGPTGTNVMDLLIAVKV